MTNKLYILCCAFFKRDVDAALALIPNAADVEVVTFPADCGQPQLSAENVTSLLPESDDSSEVLILGSVCIKNQLNNPDNHSPKQYRYFEQCFQIICPANIVNQYLIKGNYLLSPGWLSGWKKNIKQWGFNENDSKKFMQESVKTLRLIDTGVISKSQKQLKQLSKHVAIAAKTVPVGLDHLILFLEKEILLWRNKKSLKTLSEQQRQLSNYVISYELISQLSKSSSEAEIIEGIIDMFITLFAPEEIVYIPVSDGNPGKPRTKTRLSVVDDEIIKQIPDFSSEFSLNKSGTGFWLQLKLKEMIYGYIKIDKLTMPQYMKSYINQSHYLTRACALLIENARIQLQLIDTAHLAGKAELATEVLHNIGNVINSVNVSANYIKEQLDNNVCKSIPAVVELIEQNKGNLGEFIDKDPQGKNLPEFFSLLNKEFITQSKTNENELSRLISNIEQVKGIIRSQQTYSRDSNLYEYLRFEDLSMETINIFRHKIDKYEIYLEEDYADTGILLLPKYKLLQILSNLLTNAIDALTGSKILPHKLLLSSRLDGNKLIIQVTDNVVGIAENDIIRIFQHGYSIKSQHSGYGLHSVANLITEIDGNIEVKSKGKNKGACFKLTIPITRTKEGSEND